MVRNVFCAYLRPPETFFQKRYFLPSRVVKTVFWCICAYFHTTRNFFKRDTFYRLEWLKTCQDHQKLFFKKDIFERLEWLKPCFDAFAHTSRPPETFFQKTIFYHLEWLKLRVLMHLRILPYNQKLFQKRYFLPSGVVKNVFWCICTYFHTTRNFF